MQFREHRGSLEDSMKTLIEIENRDHLLEHCKYIIGDIFDPIILKVEIYDKMPDNRIA